MSRTKILLGIAWASTIIFMFTMLGIVLEDRNKNSISVDNGLKKGDTLHIQSNLLLVDSVRNDTAFYHIIDSTKK